MTLEEKIGQMNLESPSIVGGFEELIEMMTDGRISQEEFQKIMSTAKRDLHEDDIRKGLVGAMMVNDPKENNELQRIAVEESRLGIPLLIGFDVIHGLGTCIRRPERRPLSWLRFCKNKDQRSSGRYVKTRKLCGRMCETLCCLWRM